jgi:hypothetical protein
MTDEERDARRALTCLYIAVPEDIARDVETKVHAWVTKLLERIGTSCGCGRHHWVCMPCLYGPAVRERDDARRRLEIYAERIEKILGDPEWWEEASLAERGVRGCLEDEWDEAKKLADAEQRQRHEKESTR